MLDNIKNIQLHEVCIEATAAYFGINSGDLTTYSNRTPPDVYRRNVCFYLIRRNNQMLSYRAISEIFGVKKDTVRHGYLTVEDSIVMYRNIMKDVRKIQEMIDKINEKRISVWLGQ